MEEENKKISTLEYKFWADNQEIDRDTPFYEKLRKIYEEEEIEETGKLQKEKPYYDMKNDSWNFENNSIMIAIGNKTRDISTIINYKK